MKVPLYWCDISYKQLFGREFGVNVLDESLLSFIMGEWLVSFLIEYLLQVSQESTLDECGELFWQCGEFFLINCT